MNYQKQFEDNLRYQAMELARIGNVSISRMESAEASLRRTGAEYVKALVDGDMKQVKDMLSRQLQSFTGGGSSKELPSVPTWRVSRLNPLLRQELDRRMAASASLIKINREQMIKDTIQRFTGWATSEPNIDRLVSPPRHVVTTNKQENDFTVRRVRIDQTQKLRANVADIAAKELRAIAFTWRGRDDSRERETHRKRNGKIYLMRDSWAVKDGLVKVSGVDGWGDEFDDGPPGIPVFCRCHAQYIFDLEDLPSAALTEKGREYLENKKAGR